MYSIFMHVALVMETKGSRGHRKQSRGREEAKLAKVAGEGEEVEGGTRSEKKRKRRKVETRGRRKVSRNAI